MMKNNEYFYGEIKQRISPIIGRIRLDPKNTEYLSQFDTAVQELAELFATDVSTDVEKDNTEQILDEVRKTRTLYSDFLRRKASVGWNDYLRSEKAYLVMDDLTYALVDNVSYHAMEEMIENALKIMEEG